VGKTENERIQTMNKSRLVTEMCKNVLNVHEDSSVEEM